MRPDAPPDSVPPGSVAAWSSTAGQQLPDPERGELRYAVGGELGRGGMGVVASTVDTWLDRVVAVKRPLPGQGDAEARVAHEARMTARLVHPAIPPIYDVGRDDDGPYYTMPVLVGTTLHDSVTSGAGSLRLWVDAVAAASRAAGYAHARGVVHRDLKPANVLLGAHGEVWVLDWGLAMDCAHPDLARVGTPGFTAPELAHGQPATPASDVFSLGVTLAFVLDAQAEPHPELRSIVERATRIDPRARYPDGAALAEEVDHWIEGRQVLAHAYPPREVLWRLATRWRAPLAVAALASVVVAALGAVSLSAQRAERARADHSLSVSLAQQAAAMVRVGARPEAEVLAAHALAIEESPLARGVLMAWGVSPPLVQTSAEPPPCEGPIVEPDGHVICTGERLRLLGPDGAERWSAPLPKPAQGEGAWVGEVASARRYAGDVVVLRRSSNHLEIWRDGARALAPDRGAPTYLGLADGPVPAIFDTRRVGRLDLETGAVVWGPPTCDRIETALVRDDAVLIGCREARVFLGTLDDPGPAIPVAGSPSALGWSGGPWVGTFEGDLLFPDGADWAAVDGHVGAVRQVMPLDRGRVVLVGERGAGRVLAPREQVVLDALPRGVRAVSGAAALVRVWGDTVRTFTVDPAMRPVVFDRSSQGGIAAFDVSESGADLVAGSATGEVVTWRASTGAATPRAAPGESSAKAVLFLDGSAIVHAAGTTGLRRVPLDGSASTDLTSAFARSATRYRGGLALLPWSSEVILTGTPDQRLPLPSRPVAATVADTLWVTDERGAVHALEAGRFVHRFDLPSTSSALASSGSLLLASDGPDVVAMTQDGAARWRWHGAATVSALAASDAWVVVGDVDGRVVVLRPDGAVVAQVTGHTRRVSSVVLRGDVLYTASWDGLAHAWSLTELDRDGAAWVARVTHTWGLSLSEAQARADVATAED